MGKKLRKDVHGPCTNPIFLQPQDSYGTHAYNWKSVHYPSDTEDYGPQSSCRPVSEILFPLDPVFHTSLSTIYLSIYSLPPQPHSIPFLFWLVHRLSVFVMGIRLEGCEGLESKVKDTHFTVLFNRSTGFKDEDLPAFNEVCNSVWIL